MSAPPDYLQLTAFDLQQDVKGQWLVVEEHLGVADGASYALKKRQVLRQIAPALFDGLEILPIEDFRRAGARRCCRFSCAFPMARARGVLLAQGSSDEYYLDDAALARQMGVPIVQGNDLVVLDSRLYLKTIAGIEPVDVLLRRMTTSLLDPVIFDPASPLRRTRPALVRAQGARSRWPMGSVPTLRTTARWLPTSRPSPNIISAKSRCSRRRTCSKCATSMSARKSSINRDAYVHPPCLQTRPRA